MAHRRKILVGNWKMNGLLTAGLTLAKDLAAKAADRRPLPFDVVICPPVTLLWALSEAIAGSPIMLGAQDCHTANHGAYTGNISAGMLTDLGARYVILGHSERRTQHGETNELVAQKVAAAQLAGLTAIVCVGETAEERAAGTTEAVITQQVRCSLPTDYKTNKLIIAYEPVWAIGSGQVPEVEDIRAVHRAVRKALGTNGEIIQVLYGGSVTPNNASAILAEPEVDGALVGGASLNADGFWVIAEACA